MEIEIYPSKFDLKTYPATKEQSSGGGSGGGDDHNKGWFADPSALPTTGENGDYAIVGSTDTIWVWDSDTNKWVDGAYQNKITSTAEVNVAPTSAQTATSITGALAKPARVIVVPKYTNIGAVYVKETNTYSAINPIYPDPVNNVYEFTNMQNVKVFVDSLGDSVDLVIEYRG